MIPTFRRPNAPADFELVPIGGKGNRISITVEPPLVNPGPIITTQTNSNSSGASGKKGDYSHLKEPKNVKSGAKTTSAQRKRILAENEKQNNGELRSDGDGRRLNPPKANKKGEKADPNQAEVDHIDPRSKGGSNSNSNQRVISKEENLKKGNRPN